ncbi:MAG: DUF4350 domain-containing protein [Planctomycetota bacterium]
MSEASSRRLLILTIVIVVFAALINERAEEPSDETRLNPRSALAGGGRGLADALGELGVVEGRLDRPWSDWIESEGDCGLVVIAPTAALDDFEVERLVAWLEQGGRMVWVPSLPREVSDGQQLEAPDRELAERLGVRTVGARPHSDAEASARLVGTPPPRAAQAFNRSPEAFGAWSRALVVDGPCEAWLVDGADRPCVAELTLGAGRVLVWGDALGLRNDRARQSPSAAAFVRSTSVFLGPEPALLDGFGHGLAALGSVELALWRWLVGAPSGQAVLLALAVALAWLVASSIRTAPVVAPPPPPGRSSVEHVEALAAAYARADAHERPARLLVEHAASRLGSVDLPTRLDALERTHPELRPCLTRVRRATEMPRKVRVVDLPQLADDLDQVVSAGRESHPTA